MNLSVNLSDEEKNALEEKISQIEVILRAKYGEMENMRWHAVKLLEQDPEVMKDHPVDISHIAEKTTKRYHQ